MFKATSRSTAQPCLKIVLLLDVQANPQHHYLPLLTYNVLPLIMAAITIGCLFQLSKSIINGCTKIF